MLFQLERSKRRFQDAEKTTVDLTLKPVRNGCLEFKKTQSFEGSAAEPLRSSSRKRVWSTLSSHRHNRCTSRIREVGRRAWVVSDVGEMDGGRAALEQPDRGE
jgi:hypothetical protein